MSESKKVRIVSTENFEKTIKSSVFTIVDCWAPWCSPCRMFSPIMDELAEKYSKIMFAKLNIDENETIAIRYGIMSIPTILFFREGKLIDTVVGAVPKSVIEEKIEFLS
ncbi:MAG: thioredoxin [Candidatus Bathyarchaeota archaeon]